MGIVRDVNSRTSKGSAIDASPRLDRTWVIFERYTGPVSSRGEAPDFAPGAEEEIGQVMAMPSSGGERRGRGKAKKVSAKRSSDWTVRHVLAVVDLTREGAACGTF
jgi:hypothetical protein